MFLIVVRIIPGLGGTIATQTAAALRVDHLDPRLFDGRFGRIPGRFVIEPAVFVEDHHIFRLVIHLAAQALAGLIDRAQFSVPIDEIALGRLACVRHCVFPFEQKLFAGTKACFGPIEGVFGPRSRLC